MFKIGDKVRPKFKEWKSLKFKDDIYTVKNITKSTNFVELDKKCSNASVYWINDFYLKLDKKYYRELKIRILKNKIHGF